MRKAAAMNVMDLLARARPASLEPPPAPARRAADLAAAISAARPDRQRPGNGTALRPRRAARPPLPGRRIAAVAGAAALTAAAAVSLVHHSLAHHAASNVTKIVPAPLPALWPARGLSATPASLRTSVRNAFNAMPGDIFFTHVTKSGPDGSSVTDQWLYPSQPGADQQVSICTVVQAGSASGSETELTYQQPASTQNLPGTAQAYGHRTGRIDVEYGTRTWSDQVSAAGATAPGMELPYLRKVIAAGDYTAVVTAELNGRMVVKVPVRGSGQDGAQQTTLWVDAATDLPFQVVTQGAGYIREDDLTFLSPTAANLARLNLTPPAGFKKAATPELYENITSFDGPVT